MILWIVVTWLLLSPLLAVLIGKTLRRGAGPASAGPAPTEAAPAPALAQLEPAGSAVAV